jgi:integrase
MLEEIELRQIFLHELGGERPLSMLTRDRVTVAVTTSWGGRAPATWNRQVATVRSFLGFCQGRRWLAEGIAIDLERRPEPADSTKAIPLAELERLWRRKDVKVREKALWLLHETAARASEAFDQRRGPRAAGAVTGHVQHQVQHGRDGQADRGPTDHIQRVVRLQIHSGDRVQGGQHECHHRPSAAGAPGPAGQRWRR